MAGWVILAFFAGFGLLSFLWAALGWLLPGADGAVLVCVGSPDVGLVSRYRWLRSLGFFRCPLLSVTLDADPLLPPGIEICSRETLILRLEQEWNLHHGTGNGDSSGRYQRRGISEL